MHKLSMPLTKSYPPVLLTSIAILFVLRYAHKVKKDPTISPVYELDKERKQVDFRSVPAFDLRAKLIFLAFGITIGIMVFGVTQYGWYFNEMGGLFLGLALVVTFIAGKSLNWFGENFYKGISVIAPGALLVGFARMIVVVLTEGQLMDSILFYASSALSGLSATASAAGMFVFQSFMNFLVLSGSGQAALTMPIMAPLADLVGVTRQTAVLAYQFGDGISNFFSPTSGVLLAVLAVAKIPWVKWAKWVLPLIGIFYAIGMLFVIGAQLINYQ